MTEFLNFFTVREALAAKINVPFKEGVTSYAQISNYVADLYEFALGLGALLALTMIVVGAIRYTLSAGNFANQGDAKDQITSAIYGFVLLLAAFLILYTLNPRLVSLGTIEAEPPDAPDPPKGEVPVPTNVGARAVNREIPEITVTWDDPCKPKFECRYIVSGYEDVSKENADPERPPYAQFFTGQTDVGITEYAIPPNKAFNFSIWMVQAQAEYDTSETSGYFTGRYFEFEYEGEDGKKYKQWMPEIASRGKLNPAIILVPKILPPAPETPGLALGKYHRIVITDNSTNEDYFYVRHDFEGLGALEKNLHHSQTLFRSETDRTGKGGLTEEDVPSKWLEELPWRALHDAYYTTKVYACNKNRVCSLESNEVYLYEEGDDWTECMNKGPGC